MKLYLLSDPECKWDEYCSILVRAKDENEAREIAAGNDKFGYSNRHKYRDPTATSIEVISSRGKSGFIMADFKSG